MGKVSYRPKKNQGKSEVKKQEVKQYEVAEEVYEEVAPNENQETVEEESKILVVGCKENKNKLDNIKVVGDLECEYHVYVEDYVYTYLYQLASVDFTKESSAALIGEIYEDSKEVIVRGVIPIEMDKLSENAEWIDMKVMEEIENQRKAYFNQQHIIGWMHMQPGYGTMLTMKELREHQSVFEGTGTICMLVDAINKIESMFVYDEDELREQSGYCMYYERNEEMQRFMLDHPFVSDVKQEMKDNVVSQFREIGKIRKAEYTQRKNLNLTVMAASVILIALTAVIVKMNDNKSYVDVLKNSIGGEVSNALAPIENEEIGTVVEGDIVDNYGIKQIDTIDDISGEDVEQETVKDSSNTLEINQEADDLIGPEEGEAEKTEESAGTTEKTEYTVYKVEVGDTLADICYKQYGSAERSVEVAKFNELSNTNQLYVGQELKMPK